MNRVRDLEAGKSTSNHGTQGGSTAGSQLAHGGNEQHEDDNEPEGPVDDIAIQPPRTSSPSAKPNASRKQISTQTHRDGIENGRGDGDGNGNELGPTPTSLSTVEARRVTASYPASQANPRNWTERRKMGITITLLLTGFISTAGSSIGIPGMHAVRDEFGVGFRVGVLIPGAYVLGLGTGPFVFAPISELYGRQIAYISSQTTYCIFFLGTGFSNNMATLIVLRFFCGVFASVPPSLGVATCADLYEPSQRGKPISIYALGPLSGPILGNMLGYWLLYFGWRWAYYFMTIVATLNTILLLVVMRETYAPVIQKILVYNSIHTPTKSGNKARSTSPFNPMTWLPDLSWMPAMVTKSEMLAVYGRAFSRPPRLLFTNPVAFAFSMYYAYLYGLIYLFLTTIPLLFGKPPFSQTDLFSYEWPQGTLPLSYLGLGLGFGSAAIVAANLQDRIYKYLSKRNGDKGQPEYRLVLTACGMITMPIGLFIYGWTANSHTHWIAPIIGQYLIGIGLVLPFNTIQNFLVDAFHPYSAAAIAGATAARSIVACILPLFASEMFEKLDWGWGNTLLACVAILGIPAPFIMFLYGKTLRERYAFQG
ncbi:uncharacterized protein I303_102749 [Kwoniella dejecticola CBS 10117]|uniref:Major facilitator superfamily (MFS) profile domain-containing protein n=1 Tax=Kwoniella dejecticola CBS 10117 TaxID=1296121 RepID=A0A1A6A9M5_9TREE|nr:uncharacterized protein I303_02764 [Kwoniella dejecticola CBS 10117]OBR86750.1 hypothetical protein I303_02764 [Kwoniella dejecticola CBS 10117]